MTPIEKLKMKLAEVDEEANRRPDSVRLIGMMEDLADQFMGLLPELMVLWESAEIERRIAEGEVGVWRCGQRTTTNNAVSALNRKAAEVMEGTNG